MPFRQIGFLRKGAPVPSNDGSNYFTVTANVGALVQAALDHIRNHPNEANTKTFENIEYQLVELNGAVVWLELQAQPQAQPIPAMEDNFVNAGFDWLTYESAQNKIRFRKSNQRREVGLYLVNLKDVDVWVRDHVDPAALAALVESFFPDNAQQDIISLSHHSWPWQSVADEIEETLYALMFSPSVSPVSKSSKGHKRGKAAGGLSANRRQNVLHMGEPRVVLPYNYWDNDERSKAIATNENEGPHPRQLQRQDTTWYLWKTASRSSVMQLGRVMPAKAKPQEYEARNWTAWNFKPLNAQNEREAYANQNNADPPTRLENDAFLQEVQGATLYSLANRTDHHFSVKTGVCWVGFHDQKFAHKDIIGDWKIACLRSDYIAGLHQETSGWARMNDIGIQTELLTVVEKDKTRLGGYFGSSDGVSVRDIAMLSANKAYIPPLTIPMLDIDHKTLKEEFSLANNAPWCAFWRDNYAAALGKAKALFLLRYGLQHGNPNVQNYLLEFAKSNAGLQGPSRVIIRDVQDALIHREVIWALYGDGGAPPEGSVEDAANTLQKLRIPSLRYQFEDPDLWKEETGSTDPQFGPPGTQMGWFRFSVFCNVDKPLTTVPAQNRQRILELMSEWGPVHAAAYLNCVEESLGVEIRGVDWLQALGAKTYDGNNDRNNFFYGQYQPQNGNNSTFRHYSRLGLLNEARIKERFQNAQSQIDDPGAGRLAACIAFQVQGTGFTRDAVVSVEGQNIERSLFESPESIVIWIESNDTLTRQIRENSLTVKVVTAGDTLTLAPRMVGELAWEEAAATKIHELLASPAGQQKLRDYKARRWEPAPVSFRIKLINCPNPDGLLTLVEVRRGNEPLWYRPVRADGSLLFFDPIRGYQVRFPGKHDWRAVANLPKQGNEYTLDVQASN